MRDATVNSMTSQIVYDAFCIMALPAYAETTAHPKSSSASSEMSSNTSMNFVPSCSFAGLVLTEIGSPVSSTATRILVPGIFLNPSYPASLPPLWRQLMVNQLKFFAGQSFLPCLCADLISPDRILFQMPFCRSPRNRRCAAGFGPHLSGMSARLHPVANANKTPLIVVPSSHLGRPVFAGFGDCGEMAVLHWASETSL